MNVIVKYTPANSNPWSQAPAATVHVPPGSTTLNWSIQVIPASAGTIVFSTTSPAGVVFTGTGDNKWPGTAPTGDPNGWSSTINNQRPRGGTSVKYPYVVNALYTPSGGTQVAVQYDPDVQEDPPNIAVK
jgi:hypothetical protein